MKKISIYICLFFMGISPTFAQDNFNLELVSVIEYAQNCNDVWGYVADDGTEYAIFGTTTGTAIIDLSDPENPVEVQFIPGATSVWRDMKNWGHFVYVTTDQGQDGLTVIDMSGAPDNITWELWKPEIVINGEPRVLEKCHNLYIDENGVCYLSGCNMNSGGVLLIDVFTTPGKPAFISASDARYSHDSYARGDTLYSSDINAGSLSIIDVSDKTKPVTLVQQETSFRFTHNAWISDDSKYVFTTDERANAFIDAYDISDLDNIRKVDRYRPVETEGKGVIPHNVHVKDGFLVISYYTDGIVVVDANRPENLVKVGSYDTWSGAHGGFNGCWGAYPWLPSGLLLASDINSGFFLLRPEYVRASYLEGRVTDGQNGMNLNGVKVQILGDQQNLKESDASGLYKTGIAKSGEFTAYFSKPGYEDFYAIIELINGEITTLDVVMQPARSFIFSGQVVDAETGTGVPNPVVMIENTHQSEQIVGNSDGTFEFLAYEGITRVISGAWGYKYYNEELFSVETQNFILVLEKGYEDDFIFDYDWTVSGDAPIGQWERAVPQGGGQFQNPPADIPNDLGQTCYVTGPLAGNNSGAFDVDDGITILTSPIMDLSSYELPVLSYYRWYHNSGGNTEINDTLKIFLSNGSDEILLEEVWGVTNQNGWVLSPSFDVASLIELTDQMQIRFEASDFLPNGHIVEAAVDVFRVVESIGTSTDETAILDMIQIAPNPNHGNFSIRLQDGLAINGQVILTNTSGKIVWNQKVDQASVVEVNTALQPGLYFIQILGDNKIAYVSKVMVH